VPSQRGLLGTIHSFDRVDYSVKQVGWIISNMQIGGGTHDISASHRIDYECWRFECFVFRNLFLFKLLDPLNQVATS
jgi:hypothetical protein